MPPSKWEETAVRGTQTQLSEHTHYGRKHNEPQASIWKESLAHYLPASKHKVTVLIQQNTQYQSRDVIKVVAVLRRKPAEGTRG